MRKAPWLPTRAPGPVRRSCPGRRDAALLLPACRRDLARNACSAWIFAPITVPKLPGETPCPPHRRPLHAPAATPPRGRPRHGRHRRRHARQQACARSGCCRALRPISAPRYTLLGAAERIETGWWDGMPVRRDYYLARDADNVLCWIFESLDAPGQWFVHGYFRLKTPVPITVPEPATRAAQAGRRIATRVAPSGIRSCIVLR